MEAGLLERRESKPFGASALGNTVRCYAKGLSVNCREKPEPLISLPAGPSASRREEAASSVRCTRLLSWQSGLLSSYSDLLDQTPERFGILRVVRARSSMRSPSSPQGRSSSGVISTVLRSAERNHDSTQ